MEKMKSSEHIVDLYTRIPDYSEVKHLGNSDFINTLERLKEEFRVCRASLNEDTTADIDFISSQTSKVLNISGNDQRRNQNQNLYSSTSLLLLEKDSAKKTINNKMNNQAKKDLNVDKAHTKGTNPNNYYSHHNSNNIFHLTPTNNMYSNNKTRRESSAISSSSLYSYSLQPQKSQNMNLDSNYLSISASSMAIHKNPNDTLMMSSHSRQRSASMSAGRQKETETLQSSSSPFSQQRRCLSTDKYQTVKTNRDWDESAYAEDFELCSSDDGGEGSTSDSAGSGLSHWSSSPEIYNTREKEFCPPSNIEKRLLIRRAQNNSAPSIPAIEESPKSHGFKAHPVPAHVHKPLFDYIMLKNKRRSMRVREQSKQKLLAQVKPFSFSSESRIPKCSAGHHGSQMHYHQQQYTGRSEELLNNSRPTKSSARRHQNGIKTNNNKFHSSHHQFKANPAPPRTKALLAAIKLKEQQEYRELKKRLRAEALLRTAALPPSMALRDRRTKANIARLDNLLNRFNSSSPFHSRGRRYRESSSDTFTDEDRLTVDPDDFYLGLHVEQSRCNSNNSTRKGKSKVGNGKSLKNSNHPSVGHSCSRRHDGRGNFTPYGELRFPTNATTTGVFEATSNDNHASKLRIQVAKAKELERLQKEEEDLLRSMKMDKKRQKLRDYHYQAWKRAGSYSSAQDITMRRQLRMATAILERESYKKEMSTMLMRVRSAPLLLEGLRERKSEPCKKHRQDHTGLPSEKTPRNKLSSPRRNNYYNPSFSRSFFHHLGEEKSETAAFAEGSLTNSDNESVKNPELDFDHEEDQDEEDDQHDEKFVNNSKQHEIIDTMNVKENAQMESCSGMIVIGNGSNTHSQNGNGNGSKYNNCPKPFIKINNNHNGTSTSQINQEPQDMPRKEVVKEEQHQHEKDEEEQCIIDDYQGNEHDQIMEAEEDDTIDRDRNCHDSNDDFEEDIDIFEDF